MDCPHCGNTGVRPIAMIQAGDAYAPVIAPCSHMDFDMVRAAPAPAPRRRRRPELRVIEGGGSSSEPRAALTLAASNTRRPSHWPSDDRTPPRAA